MNYFRYNNGGKPLGRVWSLFTELANSEKKVCLNSSPIEFSHTVDIVNSAFSGSISLDDESINNFNLAGYEYGCAKNEYLVKKASIKKELFIVDDVQEADKELRVGFGDISARKLGTKDRELEAILNSRAFEESLNSLLGLRNAILIDYGMDVVVTLREALAGMLPAIEAIKDVVERDARVKSIILDLCDNTNSRDLVEKLSCIA